MSGGDMSMMILNCREYVWNAENTFETRRIIFNCRAEF